jgi:hypothetical protein
MNPGDIRAGMEVYALDGALLGRVYTVCEETNSLSGRSAGPASTAEPGRQETRYLVIKVDQQVLYIPFAAVTALFPGESVMLDCTADECRERFSQQPAGITPITIGPGAR